MTKPARKRESLMPVQAHPVARPLTTASSPNALGSSEVEASNNRGVARIGKIPVRLPFAPSGAMIIEEESGDGLSGGSSSTGINSTSMICFSNYGQRIDCLTGRPIG